MKDPITNCHTHIFTKEHVPPYIAKTFIFWPFYKLFHVGFWTSAIKYIYAFRNNQLYNSKSLYNQLKSFLRTASNIKILKWAFWVVTVLIFLNSLLIIYGWLSFLGEKESIRDVVDSFSELLKTYHLYIGNQRLQVLAVSYILLLFPDLRRLLIKILSIPFRFISAIPGKKISSLLERYMLLGKFALHDHQSGIYTKLQRQYPKGSKLVILPMDMEEMEAGKVSQSYLQQLSALKTLKQKDAANVCKPFIFTDPRRIKKSNAFFDWSTGLNNEVILDNKCEVYDCIINNHFNGFKIYPALGYYPFDHNLLPLWKYAADNELPIMSHTIRGTIYYRGKKDNKDWFEHPILKKAPTDKPLIPIQLEEKKNIDWTVNFTHPLNFFCLLSEPLLRVHVANSTKEVKELFGYNGPNREMDHNLSKLKVCFAHFGGEEEWVKYLEKDRYYYAQQLIQNRNQGLQFIPGKTITSTDWNRLSNYWSYVDWYSLIASMMLQYDNVYADISYLLSKPRILPLLNETLDDDINPSLRKKVLYGTDFYVVRNHFSEKDLLAQMRAGLRPNDFDQIARTNPKAYLSNKIKGHQGY